MVKFREMKTLSGKEVLAGKDAETNEALVRQAGKDEIVLHTEKAGSPFANIKSPAGKASKEDIKEAAIFCAKYSQAWKKAKVKRDVEVHYFLGKDIFKDKSMKLGAFLVRKHKKTIIKKEEIEEKLK